MLLRRGTGEESSRAGRGRCLVMSQSGFTALSYPQSRRWFSIQNSQLVYQKKLKVGKTLPAWAVGRTCWGVALGCGVGVSGVALARHCELDILAWVPCRPPGAGPC